MNVKNKKLVSSIVKSAGAILKGRLPPVVGLQSRNPWAHLYDLIIRTTGSSYKECDDERVDELIQLINREVLMYVKDEDELNSYLSEVICLKNA